MDPREGNREVAQLAGPRMPADHGLASLGLIMQLGGSIFLGYMIVFALLPLFAGAAGGSLFLFLVGASGAVRSAFHRTAGSALLYGSPQGIFRPTYTYVGVAVAQTALTLLIFNRDGGVSLQLNLTLAMLLLAWPVTLVVMLTRPRLRGLASDDALPVAEDLGFEGAASLMVLLGMVGSLVALFILYTIFKLPGGGLGSPQGLLIAGVFAMLLARSILHVVAGVKGTRGIDSDGATEAASRYYGFGVVSAVIAGGALFIVSIPEGMHPMLLLLVGVVVYLLLSWPLILRRFYTERNFVALLSGAEGPSHRRAPDAGMTSVGWLLLALGALQLGVALPSALLGGIDPSLALLSLADGSPGDLADLGAGTRSSWWTVGTAMAQIWAGVELVCMTDRHRLAPTIYGAIATIVTVYVLWPQLQQMDGLFAASAASGVGRVASALQMAISLVVPVGTIVLANRNLVPAAQARVRASSAGE
jgi:hypothetical protein